MTTKTLDDVIKSILNDSDIFGPPFDREAKASIPRLFEPRDWKRLKENFKRSDEASFNSLVDQKIKELRQNERNPQGRRKEQIEKLVSFGESLKRAYKEKPNLLTCLFNVFDSFGIIDCKLPNMEDYGKLIENCNRQMVRHFFVYKIDKAKKHHERNALKKTLEYVEELYNMNLDTLEIAFFVRKLNSLTRFMEVLKDE